MKRKKPKKPAKEPKQKFHRSDFEQPQDTTVTPYAPPVVIGGDNFRMPDWQARPELVRKAQGWFSDPDFRLLMIAMDNGHVKNLVHTVPVPPQSDSKQLGRIEGWDMFRNTLALAAVFKATQTSLVPTYAPENNL